MAGSLCFREDTTFTIVQFTDLHWQNGDPADRRTAALMAQTLDGERPDLVVLTGDVIDGANCHDPAAAWRNAVAPIVERALPWAAVFGNHDDEGTLSRRDLMAVQQALPGCLSEVGPSHLSGTGNYVLPVRSSSGDAPAAILYFLDSGSYAQTDVGGYGWITHDQVAWYLDASKRLRETNGDKALPALAFFHIPLPEYNEVWDEHPCRGSRFEEICGPRINTGFFAALHVGGDVSGTFVGHDHVNDFEGTLHGIRLCYGRATGFNTYGRAGFRRGARMIRLRAGMRDFQTWLRLEGGEVIAEQHVHRPAGRNTSI